MSLVSVAITVIVVSALGMWLGAMVFFSFIVTPRVFDVLEAEEAGGVVRAVFPPYYVFGVGLGVIAFVAGLTHGIRGGFGFRLGVFFFFVGIGVALAGYTRWLAIPRMEAGDEAAFDRYHRQSVLLNGLTIFVVALGLVAWHFV